jgi:hypothetical protein
MNDLPTRARQANYNLRKQVILYKRYARKVTRLVNRIEGK